MIVDEMHEEHPELLKDQYWDEVVPKDLPYTVASEQYRREEPKGSAELYKVKDSDALYANVMLGTQIHSHVQHRKNHQDDMYADYVSELFAHVRVVYGSRIDLNFDQCPSVTDLPVMNSRLLFGTRFLITRLYRRDWKNCPFVNLRHVHHFSLFVPNGYSFIAPPFTFGLALA